MCPYTKLVRLWNEDLSLRWSRYSCLPQPPEPNLMELGWKDANRELSVALDLNVMIGIGRDVVPKLFGARIE